MHHKSPLLLLHGALGHGRQFENFSSSLSEHFETHQLQFLGHGVGNSHEGSFHVMDLVQQLDQFVEDKKLEKPLLFGYSLGGYVALLRALRHPGKTGAIATFATKMDWSVEIAEKETKFLNPELILEKVPKYAAQLQADHGDAWKTLLKQIGILMQDIGRKQYLNKESLSQIHVPVQMMVGDRDKQVSISETWEAFGCLPDGRMAVLPATAHPFEQAENKLLPLVRQFFLEPTA